jgi:hypothetical protein
MKYGPASPAELLASLFRSRGINLNVERLEDRVAAERSRRKFDDTEHIQKVRTAATAVKTR